MVISLIALFVALGGSSYAAITVTSSNVKNNSLTGTDIKNNSVTSGDIRNDALLLRDFKASERAKLIGPQGAAGATGATGPQGPKGDKGDTGPSGATNVVVRRAEAAIAANNTAGAVAQCATGERATGGGAVVAGIDNNDAIMRSYPSTGGTSSAEEGETPTAWFARAFNDGAATTLTVLAVCAAP